MAKMKAAVFVEPGRDLSDEQVLMCPGIMSTGFTSATAC